MSPESFYLKRYIMRRKYRQSLSMKTKRAGLGLVRLRRKGGLEQAAAGDA